MAHDVLISYATVDKPTADAVCARLEERGIRCWIAPRDILPGTNYVEAIINAIDSARLTVLILSSHANLSKHVMREAERSMEAGIPIIPFRIEDVQPNNTLKYYIGPQHWLDALTPPLEKHIQKLAETILIFLGEATSPVQGVSPQPTVRTPPLVTVRPSRRALMLSATVIVIAIIIVSGAYYGIQNVAHPSSIPGSDAFSNTSALADSTLPRAAGHTTAYRDEITYRDPSIGVTFVYPKNWTTVGDPKMIDANVYQYYSIAKSTSQNYSTQMKFSVEYKSPYLTTLKDPAFSKANSHVYDVTLDSNLSNVIILKNPAPTALAGLPAYNDTWSYNFTSTTVTSPSRIQTDVFAVKGDYIYSISYSAVPADYYESLATAQQIINSFEFI